MGQLRKGQKEGWGEGESQLFAPLEMLVVVEKVITALAPGTGVDAAVFAGAGRTRLA